MLPASLCAAGLLFVGAGLSQPFYLFIAANPWAQLVVVGVALITAGLMSALREEGLAALLPTPLRLCLYESPFALGLHVRNAARSLQPGQISLQPDPLVSQLARVAALCCLDLEDALVREIVSSLDADFREAAFNPCARSLHPTLLSVVLGRRGLAQLAAIEREKLRRGPQSPVPPAAAGGDGDPPVLRRRDTKGIAREVLRLHGKSSGKSPLSPGAADESDAASAAGDLDKSSGSGAIGDLALAWKIVSLHLVVPLWRASVARARVRRSRSPRQPPRSPPREELTLPLPPPRDASAASQASAPWRLVVATWTALAQSWLVLAASAAYAWLMAWVRQPPARKAAGGENGEKGSEAANAPRRGRRQSLFGRRQSLEA